MTLHKILLVAILGSSCSQPTVFSPQGSDTTTVKNPIIYGNDGRREPYQESPFARAVAESASVALVCADRLTISDAGVAIDMQSLEDLQGPFCSGVRFVEQPALAFCSGILVDHDLVLSAGHCALNLCENGDFKVVTNFHIDNDNSLHVTHLSDIYTPVEDVVEAKFGLFLESSIYRDYDEWVFRIDRSVKEPNGPVAIRLSTALLSVDSGISVIGHPAGVPTKIDSSGTIHDPGWFGTTPFACEAAENCDAFSSIIDTFNGNSGSAMLALPRYALSGILVRGGWASSGAPLGADYGYVSGPGCWDELVCSLSTCITPESTYAARPISALCSAAPNARPCGALAGLHHFEWIATQHAVLGQVD